MTNRVSKTISDDQLNRIIQIESAGKPQAKAGTSTATGFGQFVSQTWLGTLKRHAPPELADRIVMSGGRWVVPDGGERAILNMRSATTKDLQKFNIDMLARFTEDNAKGLGAGWDDGDLYLAHFLGLGAARKVLRSSPSTLIASLPNMEGAINANKSILVGKNCGQVRAWALNAMLNRWAKAGKPDWISKYWYAGDAVAAVGVVPEDRPPVKVERAEGDADDPPHSERSATIRAVQTKLEALGYHEVGEIDGGWGGRTRGAISAYKNDRHLEGPALIDDDLVAHLNADLDSGWKRPINPSRAEATPEKVGEKIETVKQTWFSRLLAKLGFGTMGTVGIADFASDHFDEAGDYWGKANDFLEKIGVSDVPFWGWMLVGMGVMGTIWWSQRRAEEATVDAYREGKLL